MFWEKARRTYSDVTSEDLDVQKFLRLSNEFQKDVYKGVSGWIQDAGHRWIAEKTTQTDGKVLEIGFGAGRHHLFYSGNEEDYFVSEYSSAHQDSAIWKAVKKRVIRCDARRIPFRDETFQTVISIYNLEHIRDLDSVINEVFRVLKPGGRFLVALPCENGFAWNLGRELTTRRFFQKKYGINYDKVIAYEHVWSFKEILEKLKNSNRFELGCKRFYPFLLPSVNLNVVGCIECVKPISV